jgi:uncharacterized phage protein (TIGR02216 family)
MAFGLGVLRLAPDRFWAMTPREIAAAAEGIFGPLPEMPMRATLEQLMAVFPD